MNFVETCGNSSSNSWQGRHVNLTSGKHTNITMERPTMLLMGKLTISMAIFNSYFDITRGYWTWKILEPLLVDDLPTPIWQGLY